MKLKDGDVVKLKDSFDGVPHDEDMKQYEGKEVEIDRLSFCVKEDNSGSPFFPEHVERVIDREVSQQAYISNGLPSEIASGKITTLEEEQSCTIDQAVKDITELSNFINLEYEDKYNLLAPGENVVKTAIELINHLTAIVEKRSDIIKDCTRTGLEVAGECRQSKELSENLTKENEELREENDYLLDQVLELEYAVKQLARLLSEV